MYRKTRLVETRSAVGISPPGGADTTKQRYPVVIAKRSFFLACQHFSSEGRLRKDPRAGGARPGPRRLRRALLQHGHTQLRSEPGHR